MTSHGYHLALAQARIAGVTVRLKRTPASRRSEVLYDAAFRLGQLVGSGILPHAHAVSVLTRLSPRPTNHQVIDDGLRHGAATPTRKAQP